MSMNFKTFLEGSRFPVSYHVTYLTNVDDIGRAGLVPAGGLSPWRKPHLQQHSTKGIFYCQDAHCVKYWIDMMAEQSFNLSDDPIEDKLIPIILRFHSNRNASRPDKLGNAETQGNYYTLKQIKNPGIEMWNGEQWTTDISSDAVNVGLFAVDGGTGYDDEILTIRNGYPLPPELK